eukprot:140073-Hanusia_phi.AAC.4
MVVTCEFRIPMPMTVQEYFTGQLYMTAKTTRMEAARAGGAGVEILKNEPCEHPKYGRGQYTLKLYHFHHKLPRWLRAVVTKSKATLREESYNCFPYIKTTLTIDSFKKFQVVVETQHLASTEEDNVHNLNQKHLSSRRVQYLDIATDEVEEEETGKMGAEDPKRLAGQYTRVTLVSLAVQGSITQNWTRTSEERLEEELPTLDVRVQAGR